jgi:hypothetical protein
LFLAAALLAVEAAVAVGYGILEATHIVVARFVVGAGVSLLLLGYGALLAAVARGVARGRRWSRGPAVATQLLQGLLATSFTGPTRAVGWALGASALVVLVCLLTRAATAVFTRVESEEAADGEAGPNGDSSAKD